MTAGWVPDEYLEAAVRDVLTAAEPRVDTTVGFSALLLASAGAAGESDRLVSCWREVTERPSTTLTADPVHARAWAMLFAARGERPEWAAELTPLDLDTEERAHLAYLRRHDTVVPMGPLGDSPVGKIVSGLADKLGSAPRVDKVRAAAADAQRLARSGDPVDLGTWAELARARTLPEVPALAACRHLAPLLVAGADPLGLRDWAPRCAGDLIAALHQRYPRASRGDLVSEILRLRGADAPPGTSPNDLADAERRLGASLPGDYRDFLLTCDGLPADDVFPRLLSASELMPSDGGVVLISEPSEHGVIALTPLGDGWLTVELDPVLGTTTHRSFRALLTRHLRLLARSR